MKNRYLEQYILDDLKEKMVFVGGPRQVGKTTMALRFLAGGDEEHPAYLNWDFPHVKQALLKGMIPGNQPLLLFDEIHKYKDWRNLLKGLFDRYKKNKSFLVTGSARLDYYRRGGDSLQGRYHYYRLHPFTLNEMSATSSKEDLNILFRFGGFPEPLFKQEERDWKRWQRERRTRVIQEDLLNLENVKEIGQLELLTDILPERVGSPLSLNSLKKDLSVAFETVDRWILILENLYYCFRVAPYGPAKIRAAKKEKKLYLWDWSLCLDPGERFENMVACHLLKYCHFIEDTTGDTMELKFLRDAEKREIDFVVLQNKNPLFATECKLQEKELTSAIPYFAERTPIPKFYQVHLGEKNMEIPRHRARLLPFGNFCKELSLV